MRVRSYFFLLALLLLPAAGNLLRAGTTGKIAGKITDATTGEPLFGTNVIVVGTSAGAASDIDGRFAVLNVPPGIYTVKFTMIGYQSVQIENVKVSTDFTTKLDASLQSTATEIGQTVVIVAQKPLVVKDMTSSLTSVSADQIKSLPVNSVQDVLRLSAGVIEDAGRLTIRGGRTSEVAYWVNGISTTDVFNGSNGLSVENSAVQELQVISGTFNAEYGQAMSGIVNIVTKTGGSDYHGQVRAYTGNYLSSRDEFSFYKNITTERDPATGLTRIVDGEVVKPLEKVDPKIYNAEFSLSGPIPFTNNELTFFTTGRFIKDQGYFYGSDWFRPNGLPGSHSTVALNPYQRYSIQGKLSYQLNKSIRLSYDLFWNNSKNERNYYAGGFNYKYNPYGIPKSFNDQYTHLVTINHVLTSSTFYELRLSSYQTTNKGYVYENPLQAVNYIQQVDTNTGAVNYVIDPNSPDGYIDPNGQAAPASNSFLNRGMSMSHNWRRTSYLTGKVDFTSQVNESNQAKVGFEARMHKLELHNFNVIAKTDENGAQITPFLPSVPAEGNTNRDDYIVKPRELSAYIQDKIEYENIIVNLGLRWDYFDANSEKPADPRDPYINLPFLDSHKNDDIATRRTYWYKKVDPKTFLSPRLGIAFPVTDRGVIHFSYGHFFQVPEFQYLYANPGYKLTASSGNVLMGNPDLQPQKTVMYEIGLQQQLTDNVGIDVTLFYRDVRDWVGTSPIIKTYKEDVAYSQYENKDYENVKGITVKFEKRFSDNYSFRIDYTLQFADGTYSNPTDAFNAISSNSAPRLALTPTNWDQRHTLNAQLIYQVSDWTLSLIGRYGSGKPYTPSFPLGESGTETRGQLVNSAILPAQRSLDFTINKMIMISDMRLELFCNIYNILDIRDFTSVYGDTGSAEYTTTIDPSNPAHNSYNSGRVSSVQDFVLRAQNFSGPRQVQLGLTLGF